MMTDAPLIFMDPFPRNEAMIYTPGCAEALAGMGQVRERCCEKDLVRETL